MVTFRRNVTMSNPIRKRSDAGVFSRAVYRSMGCWFLNTGTHGEKNGKYGQSLSPPK
jgi:hypothetical protein